MQTIEFTKISGCYQPGDRASFSENECNQLVRKGVAKVIVVAPSHSGSETNEEDSPKGEAKIIRTYSKK